MQRLLCALCAALISSAVSVSAQTAVTVEYYHLDAIGSVRVVTDKTGAVVRRHDYRPFGEGDGTTGATDSLRFSSKERDTETGADYFGARYYAQRMGRFTTVDPGHIGGNISDPQSWNAYAYARNNPLRFVDPTGTEYQVCATNAGCSVVSDAAWQSVLEDPGMGYDIQGGNIRAWVNGRWVFAGYFSYLGPDQPRTFNAAIRLAGDAAAERVKAGVTEMATNALLSAGLGALRWGFEGAVLSAQARAASMGAASKLGKPIAAVLRGITNGTAKGKVFKNWEGRLPNKPQGYYREYDVIPSGQVGRGANRIVVGQGGEVYFTGDHYLTFVRIR